MTDSSQLLLIDLMVFRKQLAVQKGIVMRLITYLVTRSLVDSQI